MAGLGSCKAQWLCCEPETAEVRVWTPADDGILWASSAGATMEPGTTTPGAAMELCRGCNGARHHGARAAMELRWSCHEEWLLLPAVWQVEDGDAHHRCCNEVGVAAGGIAIEQVLLRAAQQVKDGRAASRGRRRPPPVMQ